MAIRKIDLVNCAYSQLRISGLTVDPTPEDLAVALDRLEAMAAEWESRNICTGYNFTDRPRPNDVTNIELWTKQAFETNLAVRLIPDFNKAVPPALEMQARQALSNISGRIAKKKIREVRYPERMAIGSGNDLRYWPYQNYYRETTPPPNECSTNFIFIDDINDYQEDFTAYLNQNEVIDSFTIEADPGLSLLSSSQNGNIIEYRVRAENQERSGEWQQVKIVVTTDTGRVNTRLINFDVEQSNTVGTL